MSYVQACLPAWRVTFCISWTGPHTGGLLDLRQAHPHRLAGSSFPYLISDRGRFGACAAVLQLVAPASAVGRQGK